MVAHYMSNNKCLYGIVLPWETGASATDLLLFLWESLFLSARALFWEKLESVPLQQLIVCNILSKERTLEHLNSGSVNWRLLQGLTLTPLKRRTIRRRILPTVQNSTWMEAWVWKKLEDVAIKISASQLSLTYLAILVFYLMLWKLDNDFRGGCWQTSFRQCAYSPKHEVVVCLILAWSCCHRGPHFELRSILSNPSSFKDSIFVNKGHCPALFHQLNLGEWIEFSLLFVYILVELRYFFSIFEETRHSLFE